MIIDIFINLKREGFYFFAIKFYICKFFFIVKMGILTNFSASIKNSISFNLLICWFNDSSNVESTLNYWDKSNSIMKFFFMVDGFDLLMFHKFFGPILEKLFYNFFLKLSLLSVGMKIVLDSQNELGVWILAK